MPSPTLSAYNYLIAGYFREGSVEELLLLVRKLVFSNQKPDGFALSMVLKLSATSVHAHIVKSAFEHDDVLFSALIDSYVKNGKIFIPSVEELRMDGKSSITWKQRILNEAYGFIKGIPEKPNSDVWGALLGAARLHGDVEMANIAAKEVFESTYMAFSNTLAEAGKWEEGLQKILVAAGLGRITGYVRFVGAN
ncbi:Pentatricopeptide repeat-containing protein, mitochondrial [Ananas comosus]|uniref:Pentatricopeptide repeat-containing protein, mitochondrial n=1 Tax=Ananas comosus TaxID=4615 RepID=A0A199VYL0_ANACO|nr:Pentatricopeptide repeat-containing protein, mitochondrial [Ananas comosus]